MRGKTVSRRPPSRALPRGHGRRRPNPRDVSGHLPGADRQGPRARTHDPSRCGSPPGTDNGSQPARDSPARREPRKRQRRAQPIAPRLPSLPFYPRPPTCIRAPRSRDTPGFARAHVRATSGDFESSLPPLPGLGTPPRDSLERHSRESLNRRGLLAKPLTRDTRQAAQCRVSKGRCTSETRLGRYLPGVPYRPNYKELRQRDTSAWRVLWAGPPRRP